MASTSQPPTPPVPDVPGPEHRAESGAPVQDESQLQALFDAMPQLGWAARSDGWIYYYNHQWYAYTGSTPEAMAGWGWQSVHNPDLLPLVMKRWTHSIATEEPFEMAFQLRRHDGAYRWFLTRVQPMRDEQGTLTHETVDGFQNEILKSLNESLGAELRTA